MIKPIMPTSLAKKSALSLLMAGAVGLGAVKANNDVNYNASSEIVSKAGADALKSNILYLNTTKAVNSPDSVKTINDSRYQYDNQGRLIGEFQLDEKGEIAAYYVYEYNEDGTPSKDVKYDSDIKIEWQKLYNYNQDGTTTELTIYSDNNTAWVCRYDSHDNLLESSVIDSDGNLELKYVYTTDSDGKRVETIYDSEGNILQKEKIE